MGESLGHEPEKPATQRPALVPAWPDLLFREVLAALLALVVLVGLAMVFDAPLEDPANPTRTPNPARAPWYFVGLQELLVYFDPWIAGVVIPVLIVAGLCAIPYLDPSRRGEGVYSRRERPLAFLVFLVGLAGWFALIAIGLFFRGPGWGWVWPGATALPVDPASVPRSLPNVVGVPLVLLWFVGGGVWLVRRTASWPGFTRHRRWVFAFLVLAMAGTALKIVLRLLFDLRDLVRFPGGGFSL